MSADRWLAFASRWFDGATVDGTFEPLIADWQHEWRTASPHRRWWVVLRGELAFAIAVVAASPRILGAPVPQALMARIALRLAVFLAIGAAILTVPFVLEYLPENRGVSFGAAFVLLLLPSQITLLVPFAMAVAVDAIRRDTAVAPHVARSAIARLVVLSMLCVLVLGGWGVQATNQSFRNMVAAERQSTRRPPPGIRELTTSELILGSDRVRSTPWVNSRHIRRELNTRAGLIALPILIAWLRWREYDRRHRRWLQPWPVGLSTLGLMTVLTSLVPFLGPWISMALVGLSAMLVHRVAFSALQSPSESDPARG